MAIRLSESRLRKIIREEVSRMVEMGSYMGPGEYGFVGPDVPDQPDYPMDVEADSAFIVVPGNDWDNTAGDEEYEALNAMVDKVFQNVLYSARVEGLDVDGSHEAGWQVVGPGAREFATGVVNELMRGQGRLWSGLVGDPGLVSQVKELLKYSDVLEPDESPDDYMPRPHNVY